MEASEYLKMMKISTKKVVINDNGSLRNIELERLLEGYSKYLLQES